MKTKTEVKNEQNSPENEQNQVRDEIQGLPNRPTLRVSEVADYYGVTERTVYLWIAHGHLKIVMTPGGQKRVTRESLDTCRFAIKRESN